MQALSQLSYGPTEGREVWGRRPALSNMQWPGESMSYVTGEAAPDR